MTPDSRALAALRALGETALRIGRPTTSFRLALAGLRETIDPDLLPPRGRERILAELDAAAAAALTPLAFKDVERALRDAWGAKPADVLDALDPEPVAVTPSSQVHRGVLDGRPVAVKVLRPGLSDAVRNDLQLADALMRPLGAALPGLDGAGLVSEVRERVLDELDLEHEGSVQRAFHRELRRHPSLRVPAVSGELTHERVLVCDWVDGTSVLELTGDAARTAAARALIAFHVGGARFGTVHADPHPANALMGDDGVLWVLDFGASRRVDPARVESAVAALDALADDEPAAFAAALDQLGWLPESAGAEAHAIGRDLLAPFLSGPARLDAAALRAVAEQAAERVAEIAGVATRATVPPEDLWPLRMLGGLVTLLARLGVTEDWVALTRAAMRAGYRV